MQTYGYINRGLFAIIPNNLYNEIYLESLEKERGLDRFNIYLVCKIPRFEFIKEKTEVTKTRVNAVLDTVKGEVRVHWDMNTEELYYNNDNSTRSLLVFNRKKTENKKDVKMPISKFDFLLKLKPEIIYIGKSKRMSKRLKLHEKIQQILAEKDKDDEIRIYLMSFGSLLGSYMTKFKPLNTQVANIAFSEKEDEEYIINYSIFESVLINFYKPKYNKEYVETDLRSLDLIKTNLIENDVEEIVFTNLLHPKNPKIWSTRQQLNSAHFCYSTIDGTFEELFDLHPRHHCQALKSIGNKS